MKESTFHMALKSMFIGELENAKEYRKYKAIRYRKVFSLEVWEEYIVRQKTTTKKQPKQ